MKPLAGIGEPGSCGKAGARTDEDILCVLQFFFQNIQLLPRILRNASGHLTPIVKMIHSYPSFLTACAGHTSKQRPQ